MELSPRLRMIAELVPKGACFADIGTDHAYLPVWLILQGVIDRAVAADLRSGPLDRARETAEKYDVSQYMDFRLCDGLTGIKEEEADVIVIAGMGGETISHILTEAPWTKSEEKMLILQPMSSQEDLRQWLTQNGYAIEKECIAREDKTLYTIMVVKAGREEEMTAAELLAGRQSSDPLRGDYLDLLISKLSRALDGQRSAAHRNDETIKRTSDLLESIKKMKEEWAIWQQ